MLSYFVCFVTSLIDQYNFWLKTSEEYEYFVGNIHVHLYSYYHTLQLLHSFRLPFLIRCNYEDPVWACVVLFGPSAVSLTLEGTLCLLPPFLLYRAPIKK